VAYLCLGYVSEFLARPELETAGWRARLPLESLMHDNRWGGLLDSVPLRDAVHDDTGTAT
jgi:5,6-dimethylbenzimidazole synthase